MADRHMPASADRAKRMFYTRRGFLTRYALACGYVEIRGDAESGVRLEQVSSNGLLRVAGTGRWLRHDIYNGPSLRDARHAFMAFNHLAASYKESKS